ncbi:response regulator transcription factor [Williamsia deligens]|uniref:Response regulator transcription factor n=1 Tax=Williamsia deligens TaxID=321325 RepID=A0ABW3G6U4_9NOCA|nr:LuxR C-terminal-related transcriptional regulator [Williamsia deligens]
MTELVRPALSPREKEVLRLWIQSESKDEVGSTLVIAPATVMTHIARIRGKYSEVGRPARTKAQLLARALQDGLIELDEL